MNEEIVYSDCLLQLAFKRQCLLLAITHLVNNAQPYR